MKQSDRCGGQHPRLFALIVTFALAFTPQDSPAQFASDYETNIISGVVSNWTGDYYIGSNTVFDQLQVISGGALSNAYGFIGVGGGGSNNSVLLSGSGSVWSNQFDLTVGYQGGSSNALVINNAGKVINGSGYIGNGGNNNTVSLSGSGSVWSNLFSLRVGNQGGSGNLLTIDSAARVNVQFNGYIGVGGNSNRVLLSGSGSTWKNIGDLFVGSGGNSNSLIIQSSAVVFNNSGTVGNSGNANGVVVTGAGAVWSNSGTLLVGNSGSGNWVVASNGASVFVGIDGNIGKGGRSNSVLITDSGTTWTNKGDISAGYKGKGANSMVISNGAGVSSPYGFVGNSDNGSWAIIDGAGSVWVCQSNIFVGCACDSPNGGNSNTLIVRNGGKLVTRVAPFNGYSGAIGYNTANNRVLITGAGSVWSNNESVLFVGTWGSGPSVGNSLVISNGGTVAESSLLRIGGSPGAISNSLVIADGGTALADSMRADPMNFVRLAGGNLTTVSGSEISSNASLTGCGTVTGPVVIDPGGTIAADCASGVLTFTGAVTNNGTMRALNGSVLESYGPLVNNGIIDIMSGTTNFHSSFVNNGFVVDASYFQVVSVAAQGNNILLSWTALGGRSYVVQMSASGVNSNNFTDTGPTISASGTGEYVTNYLDVGGATNVPSHYYRIRLVP